LITTSGSFLSDGKDGILYCRTLTGYLDQAGTYNVQSYIELPDFVGYSTTTSFTVYANLPT
jgi:hypothetical protein